MPFTICNCCGQVFNKKNEPIEVVLKCPNACGGPVDGVIRHKGKFSAIDPQGIRYPPVSDNPISYVNNKKWQVYLCNIAFSAGLPQRPLHIFQNDDALREEQNKGWRGPTHPRGGSSSIKQSIVQKSGGMAFMRHGAAFLEGWDISAVEVYEQYFWLFPHQYMCHRTVLPSFAASELKWL